jgi:hypothetical protein
MSWLLCLAALVFVFLFSAHTRAYALSPQACCEGPWPPPQFAPPPPPLYPQPYRVHPYHPPYRPPRQRPRLEEPQILIEIGKSQFWYEPDDDHLSFDLELLSVVNELHVKRNLYIGTGMRLLKLQSERWPLDLQSGDYWLTSQEWVNLYFSLRHKNWYLRSGWTAYRGVEWGLPDNVAKSIASDPEQTDYPTSFKAQGPRYMLPQLATGFRYGPMSAEIGGAILNWDLRSYQAYLNIAVETNGLGLTLNSTFQNEAMRFVPDQKEDKNRDNQPAVAIWERQYWEASLIGSLDFARLFGWNKKQLIGPLKMLLGVRYRHILHHHFRSITEERLLFHQVLGGHWAVFLGLQVAFGQGNPPTLRF